MIETVFTLEDEPMTPETPQEGGAEGGQEEMPVSEPESRLGDEEEGEKPSEDM